MRRGNSADQAKALQFRALLRDVPSLTMDEVKTRLEPLMLDFTANGVWFDPGAVVYRARRLGPSFSKAGGVRIPDLSYPPPGTSSWGRANRPGESVFYGSLYKASVFYELPGLAAGDELLLGFWQTAAKMTVNSIGYTQRVFDRLRARRPLPAWHGVPTDGGATISLAKLPRSPGLAEPRVKRGSLLDLVSSQFTSTGKRGASSRYKLTTAIAEAHLGTLDGTTPFAGVLYPSVQTWANGDNVALTREFVDWGLRFMKVVHIRIDSVEKSRFKIVALDEGRQSGGSDAVNWLGRLPQWVVTVPPGGRASVRVTAGADADGDYFTDAQGRAAHWEVRDPVTDAVVAPG